MDLAIGLKADHSPGEGGFDPFREVVFIYPDLDHDGLVFESEAGYSFADSYRLGRLRTKALVAQGFHAVADVEVVAVGQVVVQVLGQIRFETDGDGGARRLSHDIGRVTAIPYPDSFL